MKLSIVATLYQSADSIDEFYRRATRAAADHSGDDYEIVLVNDGSPDASLEIALTLVDRDPRVVVVDLSRNFGHHKAMMTGLAHAGGDLVYLLDSDLEEEPEWLASFATQLAGENCDVVYGVQQTRKGGWFERRSGQLYYDLMPRLTGVELPQNMITARLMTRRYVQALLLHKEREVDIGGLWAITGFAQRPQYVTKHHSSPTTYTVRRKLDLFVNSVTSFSNAPLIGIFYVGMLLLAVAVLTMAVVFVQWLFLARPVSGWTSLILSVWLLGGLMISFLGVIGIYLAKTFSEVKRRPYTIVKAVHGRSPAA